MRYLQLIIYLGFTAIVQGQGVHDDPYDIKFLLKRLEVEDSIEGFPKGILQKHILDTLPVYTTGDNIDWRDMKHAIYFYEDTGLRSVHFFNGRIGTYSFYFKNGNVQKVCVEEAGMLILRYYFSAKHNEYSFSEIQSHIIKEPEFSNYFETLRLSKVFLNRFKILWLERST